MLMARSPPFTNTGHPQKILHITDKTQSCQAGEDQRGDWVGVTIVSAAHGSQSKETSAREAPRWQAPRIPLDRVPEAPIPRWTPPRLAAPALLGLCGREGAVGEKLLEKLI